MMTVSATEKNFSAFLNFVSIWIFVEKRLISVSAAGLNRSPEKSRLRAESMRPTCDITPDTLTWRSDT